MLRLPRLDRARRFCFYQVVLGIIRTMKVLQRIEFWLFSVPALVVTIGGIAHYGAWRVLWAFPVCFTLAAAIRFMKTLVVDLVDEPRIRACRSGKWPLAYLLILPIALYDWLAVTLAVDFATLATNSRGRSFRFRRTSQPP